MALLRPTSSLRRTGLGAGLLLVLLLLIIYGAGWYVVGVARVSQEAELARHLRVLGELALPELSDDALALADLALDARWLAGEDDPASAPLREMSPRARAVYANYLSERRVAALEGFVARGGLARLLVLAPDTTVLYDTAAPEALLTPFDYAGIDGFELGRAIAGEAAASLAYQRGDQSYKRLYLPVREGLDATGGETRAVLVLVANRDYLHGVEQLARRLRRHALQLTILTLLIGVLIWRLIRRQRRIESQAAEADRLAALGSLAAGFAHELRNPLGIIRAFAEDLERSTRNAGEPARRAQIEETCHDIVEEIDRMDRLVAQFLEYSRPGAAATRDRSRTAGEPARLGRDVPAVLGMLRAAAQKRQVELNLEWTPEAEQAGPLPIDSGAFRQVLLNLVLNALAAAPEQTRVRVQCEVTDGEARLRVTDEGPGIAERDRTRIFDPFYTTRSDGSGLGLTVSRRLVAEAGGSLTLEKRRAQPGASFLVRLPLARPAAAPGVKG